MRAHHRTKELRTRTPRPSLHPEPINPSELPQPSPILEFPESDMEIALITDAASVGLQGKPACLRQVKTCDFGRRGSGNCGKSIAAAGMRSREWRSMVAKNAKNSLSAGDSKNLVATSAISSQVNGKAVMIEDPSLVEEAPSRRGRVDRDNVASIILGGAPGDHLFPLTSTRAAPAVPIGGSHRLIDIPMSNCVNSGIQKIFVMTQFNSTSLNRHISKTYSFINENKVGNTFLEVLAATQSPQMNWFRGTADAVRQFAWLLQGHKSMDIEYIVILSGDQLYRMDFMDLVQKHVDTGAQITISCVDVDKSRASNYGLLRVDTNGRVLQFQEKPKGTDLEAMTSGNSSFLKLHRQGTDQCSYIASMGVYVFNKSTLMEILRETHPRALDFGSQILPCAVSEYNVQAYMFDGYWEDIGTIKSFFDANMALTDQIPNFQFYDPKKSIITSSRYLPPTKIEKCRVMHSIISHGCFLDECSIKHSIIGIRSCISYGAHLKRTLMMGSDKYETGEEIASLNGESKVPIGVGQNTQISNCIIDLNARIGKNVVIANKDGVQEANRPNEGFYIRSGITIITKNATIKDETVI